MENSVRNNERGVAMILVISMLSIMLVVALTLMTQATAAKTSGRVLASRGKLKYANESATSRALWFYLWDRKKYTRYHRGLGNSMEDDDRPEEDGVPIQAINKPYKMLVPGDGFSSSLVTLVDAVNGEDITSVSLPGRALRKKMGVSTMEDFERKTDLEAFTYALDDYVDSGDYYAHSDYHYERDDYESADIENFPVNTKMQVVEEMYWIPYVDKFVGGQAGLRKNMFCVIPPRKWRSGPSRIGTPIYSISGKKSAVHSSDVQSILERNGIEDQELIDQYIEFKNGSLAWEDLDPELRSIINQQMTRDESGVTRFLSTSSMYNGDIIRTTEATFNCNQILKDRKFFRCWEHKVY
ncbi:MAG: hypothetical protein KAG98_05675 [Lentisphaeria bacterium]|nr:hypothetical protein [Lentisphaeria bacterium]